tara:strand:- start:53913 stop:54830 length:918 start_codon:yes stop_codon:yes gene_type:complete
LSPSSLQIRVPATTANLGPGFDILGIALSLGTDITFQFQQDADYGLSGADGKSLPIPLEKNLIARSYQKVLEQSSVKALPWTASVRSDLLPGRGFGSSAMALVAGILAANERLNQLGKNAWPLERQIALLSEMEGHPDNVIPARVGGWICSLPDGKYLRRTLPDSFSMIILVPEKQMSTKESRGHLPDNYPLKNCVSNMRGLAAWFDYIDNRNKESLKTALRNDLLHEPYRTHAVEGFKEIREISLDSGCLGSCLSGSGPGIAIFYEKEDVSKEPLERIISRASSFGYTGRLCEVDYNGAVTIRN